MHVADDTQKLFNIHFFSQMMAHFDHIYLAGYHFIKMFNRPVDLAMRFIVVCVAEPLTLKEKGTSE